MEDCCSGCKFWGCMYDNELNCVVKIVVEVNEIVEFCYKYYI